MKKLYDYYQNASQMDTRCLAYAYRPIPPPPAVPCVVEKDRHDNDEEAAATIYVEVSNSDSSSAPAASESDQDTSAIDKRYYAEHTATQVFLAMATMHHQPHEVSILL
jgi:hypothetical protein